MRSLILILISVCSLQVHAASARGGKLSLAQCKSKLSSIANEALQRANALPIESCRKYVLYGGTLTNGLACQSAGGEDSTRAAMSRYIMRAKMTCNVCGDTSTQKSCRDQIKSFSGGLSKAQAFIDRINGGSAEPLDPILPEILSSPSVAMCD